MRYYKISINSPVPERSKIVRYMRSDIRTCSNLLHECHRACKKTKRINQASPVLHVRDGTGASICLMYSDPIGS